MENPATIFATISLRVQDESSILKFTAGLGNNSVVLIKLQTKRDSSRFVHQHYFLRNSCTVPFVVTIARAARSTKKITR